MSSRTRKRRSPKYALLILDMISEFDFPQGQQLVAPATRAARHIVDLKRQARRDRCPVIYVNDTAGVWESDQHAFVRRCSQPQARGYKIAEMLAPSEADYFLFKPRHSAFFDTSLHSLLGRLRIKRLVLCGITAHQCVLFTAMDGYIRGYQLTVSKSGIASFRATQTRHALAILVDALSATIIR
jgi:nicotinamidase-related amidase